jgi:hypothetical protein
MRRTGARNARISVRARPNRAKANRPR